ncbi:MAG: hypothetical protein KDA21_07715 [Phycisphaerales bacterium]|nr:hypothetical protein [Phycisphaerales bacterium]
MPLIGSILSGKVIGLDRDEKRVRKARQESEDAAKASFREVLDEADLSVTHVESTEDVRAVKGNDSEESHEDRVSHPFYDGHASRPRQAGPDSGHHLDLEG